MPTCIIGGPDRICSDGKCHVNGCPVGTTQVSAGTCTCASACNGTCPNDCTSSLQVKTSCVIL